MKPLQKDQEERIVGSLRQMIGLVNGGEHPNDALFKVASGEKYNPHFVRRLTEVYNVSRTLAHFTNSPPEKRADEFSIVDVDSVLKRMYPSEFEREGVQEMKAAADTSDWFREPPNFAKAAKTHDLKITNEKSCEVTFQQVQDRVKRAANILEHRAKIARQAMPLHFESLQRELVKASEYFRGVNTIPFQTFEENSLLKWGSVVKPLMDLVFRFTRGEVWGEKRGSTPDQGRVFNAGVEPYSYIANAIDHAERLVEATQKAAAARAEYETFAKKANEKLAAIKEVLRPIRPNPFRETDPVKDTRTEEEKEAAINIPTIGGLLLIGSKAKEEMGMKEEPPSEMDRRVQFAVDPEQEAQLRAVNSQVMLNDFMTNDPVLSNVPYQDLVAAYNEIARMTPLAANQPALMRSMLRKHLTQGVTDQFEAGNLVQTERALQQMHQGPTGTMG